MDDLQQKGEILSASRILFVDDGSKDKTWSLIEGLSAAHERVEGLKLAHNAGHQNALWAGMMSVKGKADAVVTIDADLQDDIQAIRGFLEKYREGCEVVYGVRSKRETDTAFKRRTAEGFYRFMRHMGVKVVYNHADYRLLGARALEALSEFQEENMFLRGLVPLVGFKSAEVYYERGVRFAGESKYPLKKMIGFAMEGVTSFTIRPIRWVGLIGVLFALMGVFVAISAIIQRFQGTVVPGWASLMVSIWVIGGVQLIALSLIGEYVGRVYSEVKRRPKYIVEEYIEKK
jgi:glycosyltransferase involved in cell wall biosynthesis